MTDQLPRNDVQTDVFASAMRRFGVRIVLAAALVGAVVGVYAYLGPHTFKATSTVLVRPLGGNALSDQTSTSNQSTTVAMETEASLVNSLAVTRQVNDALKISLSAGGSDVTAKVPANSQIVQITYTADTAQNAQRRAEAYAQAFLDYRSTLATQAQKAQLDRLNARQVSVERQLKQASSDANLKVNRPPDADIRVRLLTSALAAVQSDIGQAESTSTEPGNVVTPATLPSAPSGISPVLLTGGATLIGLIIAAAIAIGRERMDDRVRSGAEDTLFGLPVLAVLPDATRPSRKRKRKRARTRTLAAPARDEAMRRARISLLAVAPLNSVITIAGLTAREPALETAADLARALVDAGYRITLVDAAVAGERRPTLMTGGPGLSDLLLVDHLSPEDHQLQQVDGVQVLLAGTDPGGESERYAGKRTRALLDHLRQDADYVLVPTAPANTAEGLAMLLAADGVVFIATDQESTHDQIVTATTRSRRLGATVLGVVIQQSRGDGREAPVKQADPTIQDNTVESGPRSVDDVQVADDSVSRHATKESAATRDLAAEMDGADAEAVDAQGGEPIDRLVVSGANRSNIAAVAAEVHGRQRSRLRKNRDETSRRDRGKESRPEQDN